MRTGLLPPPSPHSQFIHHNPHFWPRASSNLQLLKTFPWASFQFRQSTLANVCKHECNMGHARGITSLYHQLMFNIIHALAKQPELRTITIHHFHEDCSHMRRNEAYRRYTHTMSIRQGQFSRKRACHQLNLNFDNENTSYARNLMSLEYTFSRENSDQKLFKKKERESLPAPHFVLAISATNEQRIGTAILTTGKATGFRTIDLKTSMKKEISNGEVRPWSWERGMEGQESEEVIIEERY